MRRTLASGIAAASAAVLLHGPAQAATDVTYASAAEVHALAAKVQAGMKPGQTTDVAPVLRLAPYVSNIEVRTGPGISAIHEGEAEFFVVIDGAGVMQIGGNMVGAKRADAHNITGTGLEGAAGRAIAKGDVLVVPEGTPHQIVKVDGTLILMSLHVPRGAPAP
jgi:mannose-6-phosphate isomerase-like protein (cupin superfamily)